MTRNGKIARLPKGVREELNRRLQDGESGPGLLNWLNEVPQCKRMLAKEFDSQAVTKQNLSAWKTGGYEEWLRKEESREQVQMLVEKAEDLEEEAGGMAIADRLGTVLTVELVRATEQLNSIAEPKERWARLKDITRELYRLRREDHHARKLRMAEEQWEVQSEREAKENARREKEAETKRLLKLQSAMERKPMMASLKGNGAEAWKWTNWVLCVTHELPMPPWWTDPKTVEEWSKLLTPYWYEEAEKLKGGNGGSKTEDGRQSQLPRSKDQAPSGASGAQNGSHPRERNNGVGKARSVKAGQGKSRPVRAKQTEKVKKCSVHSPESTVEDGGAERKGECVGKKNEDGDRPVVRSVSEASVKGGREACNTGDEQVQVDPSGSKQIKREASEESGGLKVADGEGERMGKDGANGTNTTKKTDGANEGGEVPSGGA